MLQNDFERVQNHWSPIHFRIALMQNHFALVQNHFVQYRIILHSSPAIADAFKTILHCLPVVANAFKIIGNVEKTSKKRFFYQKTLKKTFF
jgi:hypothetical protein